MVPQTRPFPALDVSHNSLTDLSTLGECDLLETLVADRNALVDVGSLPCLPALRYPIAEADV